MLSSLLIMAIQTNMPNIEENLKGKINEQIVIEERINLQELEEQRIKQEFQDWIDNNPGGKIIKREMFNGPKTTSRYGMGWCTRYAGYTTDNFGLDVSLGNAYEWYSNAKKLGLNTGTVPRKNSIIVFKGGNGYNKLGHVAKVEAVLENHIIITEMHYSKSWEITTRVVQLDDNRIQGYIYNENIKM